MALIEGVGDEVTILCALFLLLSVIVLAWISTHISERGSAQWSSQTYGGQNPSARHGSEEELRQPTYSGDQLCGSNDPVAEGTSSTVTGTDGSSSVRPNTSPILGDPSLGNDFTSSDHEPSTRSESPTIRHRGAQVHGDSPGSQDTITLRLKFLNETERVVNVRLTDSVLHIKRSQFPGQEPRVRLIYQGQLLRDDSQTVASLQLADGCVLHCHLSQHATTSGPGGAELSQDSVNLGSLMVPLFLLLLGILWYCQFQYPHVFNGTATACLGALTLFVLVLVFSSYRR